jgi:hypothetical protein
MKITFWPCSFWLEQPRMWYVPHGLNRPSLKSGQTINGRLVRYDPDQSGPFPLLFGLEWRQTLLRPEHNQA